MYDTVISREPIFDVILKLTKKLETVTDTTLYTIGSDSVFSNPNTMMEFSYEIEWKTPVQLIMSKNNTIEN